MRQHASIIGSSWGRLPCELSPLYPKSRFGYKAVSRFCKCSGESRIASGLRHFAYGLW